MQISDIFYHHKNMDMMNYIIWKYFYRKTWRNPVISHDIFSQNSSKICIFKILINKNK